MQNDRYEFPQQVDWLLRQLAQFGRVPAAQMFASTPLAAPLAAGDTSPAVQVKFPEPGIVIALYGQEAAGSAAALAGTEVRLQLEGVEDFFIDGLGGGTTFPLLGLVGGAQNWYPIMRRASGTSPWLVTWKNTQAAATASPRLGLSFVSDRFLATAPWKG